VKHGGRADAAVTDETTHLVVLPQPDGAAFAPAALLKAVACGEYDAPALSHLRSRLKTGRLDLVSPTCASGMASCQAARN